MNDFEFLLSDRIQKIKSINEMYDLKSNSYISFSGGKDSTVLSRLVDLALPDNNIPRLFIDTGIEYTKIVSYVRKMSETDSRITVIRPAKNIRNILEEYGYPFKSKEHSLYVSIYQNSGETRTIKRYLGKADKENFLCPEKLKYQFTDSFRLKVSNKCCTKLKKEPAEKWARENSRPITLTGMRNDEGGLRKTLTACTVFDETRLRKFHPLLVVDEKWIDTFIERYNVRLCDLYYPPFNFRRTGCKGCPFSVNLGEQLETMAILLPSEKKQCEGIWKPVYDEYRRIGFRLRRYEQLLF